MDDWWLPEIDGARCTGCGACVTACPTGALAVVDGCAAVVAPAACRYIGRCELVCVEDAIHLWYLIRMADERHRPPLSQGPLMNSYQYLPNLSEAVREIAPDSIVSRTLHTDDALKVVLFGFAEGQELSEHTASQPATLLFVEGEATVSLGGDVQPAGPGTWIYMPPNLPHTVKAHTKVIMLLLLIRCARAT